MNLPDNEVFLSKHENFYIFRLCLYTLLKAYYKYPCLKTGYLINLTYFVYLSSYFKWKLIIFPCLTDMPPRYALRWPHITELLSLADLLLSFL